MACALLTLCPQTGKNARGLLRLDFVPDPISESVADLQSLLDPCQRSELIDANAVQCAHPPVRSSHVNAFGHRTASQARDAVSEVILLKIGHNESHHLGMPQL